MQEAQECNASPSNSSGSGSSSLLQPNSASIKEEEGSPEKERPPEAEYINPRCVLFTYFQGRQLRCRLLPQQGPEPA